ncbi:MAG: glycosyltransferase family 4 protein [Opitutaceae bacterium]|jgi:glycosyltransferase involved in cell wall biosynthesis
MPDTPYNSLRPCYSGLYYDELSPETAWIRETALVRLPPMGGNMELCIVGEYIPHPELQGLEQGLPELTVRIGTRLGARLTMEKPGYWNLRFRIFPEEQSRGLCLKLELGSVWLTNALAWLGRITGFGPLQRFRKQNKNRQLRISRIETAEGEILCDFSKRGAPFATDYLRRNLQIGMNIVGFLSADLGIGESARCMVRAADKEGIATTLVPLKLHCKNPQGDLSLQARFQEDNPHPVNIFHIDPPVAADIEHHHGLGFRSGKYNIGYWAWELPDFPDAWVPSCAYFDEIWCPSDFAREAVAMKAPVPVLTMPHAISFDRPQGEHRERFGLARDAFVFLFLYDLNSYSERKNPKAVIEVFRKSGLADKGAKLAIKVHNAGGNETEFAKLREAVADIPGTILIAETLTRSDLYRLEAVCDCFVSLHRAEGFGLAVAECMYLGKPVISTDWSATAEFVSEANGCPVRCREIVLDRNHGPYGKGSHWADPDLDHAGWWMKRLFEDRTLASTLGLAARETIERRFSPSVIGSRYRKRLEAIAMA